MDLGGSDGATFSFAVLLPTFNFHDRFYDGSVVAMHACTTNKTQCQQVTHKEPLLLLRKTSETPERPSGTFEGPGYNVLHKKYVGRNCCAISCNISFKKAFLSGLGGAVGVGGFFFLFF